jgi:hypothetical protein
MKIFCTASSDTYVTNKIINSSTRATDANVGRAGTIDLFKLYGETALPTGRASGSADYALDTDADGTLETSIELSRAFIKFDFSKIQSLTGSKIDINSSNFSAKLKMFDVRTGHAVPSNFTLMAIPLSQSFDEGIGRDVAGFNDLDACNFITASYSNGTVFAWNTEGAAKSGSLGATSVDLVETANFKDGSGTRRLVFQQNFVKGTEDLSLDITPFVSASVVGLITNHGFRLSFTGSEEKDAKSRFVKRFMTRHVTDLYLQPRVEVSFDDSIVDHNQNFFFDVSGTLFLNSYGRVGLTHLVSGTAGSLSNIEGNNCLKLKLEKGLFSETVLASQHKAATIDRAGNNYVTGVYSASFSISAQNTSLIDADTSLALFLAKNGSVTFDTYWVSSDGTYAYHTGSLEMKRAVRTGGNFLSNEPSIRAINVSQEYNRKDEVRVRLFGRDYQNEQNTSSKKSIKLKSVVYENVYYRIKDLDSGKIVIDFGESDKSTKVSTDVDGMFFDYHVDVLAAGRTYTFEYLIVERNVRKIVKDNSVAFRVR